MNIVSVDYRPQHRFLFAVNLLMWLVFLKLNIDELNIPNNVVKIKGLTLSKTAGEVFLYSSSVVISILILISFIGLIVTFIKREIILDEEGISVPKFLLSRTVIKLKYSEILNHEIKRNAKLRWLIIYHKLGSVEVPSSVFSSEEDFSLVCLSVANKRLMANI